MSVNFIDSFAKLKQGFMFKNDKNIRTDETCAVKNRDDVTALFEVGKTYNLKLRDGKNAIVRMYISPDTDYIRIMYSVSCDKKVNLHDSKADELSENDKTLLREMADIISHTKKNITGDTRKAAA